MIQLAFILFMAVLIGSTTGFIKTADHFVSKAKQERDSCIMQQIKLSEENRKNYFPRMRDELLHSFILKCLDDKQFKSGKHGG